MKGLFTLITAVVLAGLLISSTVARAAEADLFKLAEEARQTLEQDKNAQQLRHHWFNVIKKYERIVREYPKGKNAPQSHLAIGDLYLGLFKVSRRGSDLESAEEAYRKLIKTFPSAAACATAQLQLGRIYFHYKGDPDRAYVELLKVELNYPKSRREIDGARDMMNEITEETGLSKPSPSAPEPKDTPPAPAKQPAGQWAKVNGIRYWHNDTYSRVAIDLDREVRFEDHILKPDPKLGSPMRLYMDLAATRVTPGIKDELIIADGLLKRARVAQFDKETVRVVLDIHNISNYRIFSLTDPFRIVVDVTGGGELTTGPDKKEPLQDLRDTAMARKKNPRGPVDPKVDQSSLAKQLGLGVNTVVIDPGHGGKDRGATGITGLKEKDLTLRVAKILAAKIKSRLGLKVLLTRDKDTFLPLEERTARANTKGADLFISIHANAHKSPNVHGVETYILNIATDSEAMRVAAMENATTTKNMSDLQMILSDLMLNSKITESGRLGAKVHHAMVKSLRKRNKSIRDLGVKQAPFYVLIGANMPSILVEMGFISNRTEEKRLRDQKYLDQLTDGLVEGIKAYIGSVKTNG